MAERQVLETIKEVCKEYQEQGQHALDYLTMRNLFNSAMDSIYACCHGALLMKQEDKHDSHK